MSALNISLSGVYAAGDGNHDFPLKCSPRTRGGWVLSWHTSRDVATFMGSLTAHLIFAPVMYIASTPDMPLSYSLAL